MIKKLLQDSAFLMLGQLFFMAANLLVMSILARHLSVQDFGMYSYAQSVVLVFTCFGYFGLQGAITQFSSHYMSLENFSKAKSVIVFAARRIFFFHILLVTALVIVGVLWGDVLLNKPDVGFAVALLALSLIPRSVTGVVLSGFQGLRQISFVTLIQNVSEPVFRLVILTFLVMLSLNTLFNWIVGLTLGLTLNALLSFFLFKKYAPGSLLRGSLVKVNSAKIYRYAIPLLPFSLSSLAFVNLDVIMLGYWAPVEQAGIYRVYKFAMVSCVALIAAVALVYHPNATSLIAKNDEDGLKYLHRTSSRWMLYMGMASAYFFATLAPWLVSTVFGTDYFVPRPIFSIVLALIVLLVSFAGPATNALQALGFTKDVAAHSILALLALATTCWMLIPSLGMLGAALSVLASQFIQQGAAVLTLSLRRGLAPEWRRHCGLVVCCFIAMSVTVLYLAPNMDAYVYTTSSIAFGFLVFFSLILVLVTTRLIPSDDIQMVTKFFKNIARKGQ